MTTPEPTEEQREAAYSWCHAKWVGHMEQDLARLLAEREHKLREENADLRADVRTLLYDLRKIHRDQLQSDLDAARARIAELEADVASKDELVESLRYDVAKLEATESAFAETDAALRQREAAHLATIKALKGALVEALEDLNQADESSMKYGHGVDTTEPRRTLTAAIAATAHCDVEGDSDAD